MVEILPKSESGADFSADSGTQPSFEGKWSSNEMSVKKIKFEPLDQTDDSTFFF